MKKIFADIAALETKLAVSYQEYKKKYPGTKKTPSDPMFQDSASDDGDTTKSLKDFQYSKVTHPPKKKVTPDIHEYQVGGWAHGANVLHQNGVHATHVDRMKTLGGKDVAHFFNNGDLVAEYDSGKGTMQVGHKKPLMENARPDLKKKS